MAQVITFEEWKKQAFECLRGLALKAGAGETDWDWILEDEGCLKSDGYDAGEEPYDYVLYQLECAQ